MKQSSMSWKMEKIEKKININLSGKSNNWEEEGKKVRERNRKSVGQCYNKQRRSQCTGNTFEHITCQCCSTHAGECINTTYTNILMWVPIEQFATITYYQCVNTLLPSALNTIQFNILKLIKKMNSLILHLWLACTLWRRLSSLPNMSAVLENEFLKSISWLHKAKTKKRKSM